MSRREHYEKYQAMAEQIGPNYLAHIIPAARDEIQAALDAGDEHLNTIPLRRWDVAASAYGGESRSMGWLFPWTNGPRVQSLGDRVCVLKHVARYYVAGVVEALD